MSDAEFVQTAKASWKRILDMGEDKPTDTVALAAALWASLNADKLIEIAERRP